MTEAQKDRLMMSTCIAITAIALLMLAGWLKLIPYFDGMEGNCVADAKCQFIDVDDAKIIIDVQKRPVREKLEPMT